MGTHKSDTDPLLPPSHHRTKRITASPTGCGCWGWAALGAGRRRQTKLKLLSWPPLSSPHPFLVPCEESSSAEGKSNSACRQGIKCIKRLSSQRHLWIGEGAGTAPALKNCSLWKAGKGREKGEGGSSTFWWLSIRLTNPNVYSRQNRQQLPGAFCSGFPSAKSNAGRLNLTSG